MLADRMASYWVNFAQTGDPNGEDLPLWPQFSREAGETMVLGTDVRIAESPVDLQLRVFDGVYDAVRGKPFGTP
jgi:para-nitrobenzyl esterase